MNDIPDDVVMKIATMLIRKDELLNFFAFRATCVKAKRVTQKIIDDVDCLENELHHRLITDEKFLKQSTFEEMNKEALPHVLHNIAFAEEPCDEIKKCCGLLIDSSKNITRFDMFKMDTRFIQFVNLDQQVDLSKFTNLTHLVVKVDESKSFDTRRAKLVNLLKLNELRELKCEHKVDFDELNEQENKNFIFPKLEKLFLENNSTKNLSVFSNATYVTLHNCAFANYEVFDKAKILIVDNVFVKTMQELPALKIDSERLKSVKMFSFTARIYTSAGLIDFAVFKHVKVLNLVFNNAELDFSPLKCINLIELRLIALMRNTEIKLRDIQHIPLIKLVGFAHVDETDCDLRNVSALGFEKIDSDLTLDLYANLRCASFVRCVLIAKRNVNINCKESFVIRECLFSIEDDETNEDDVMINEEQCLTISSSAMLFFFALSTDHAVHVVLHLLHCENFFVKFRSNVECIGFDPQYNEEKREMVIEQIRTKRGRKLIDAFNKDQ